jgi:DnaJ-class molecular chaperone
MNLYDILNIDENASLNDIKKAYNKLVLKYHPDKSKTDSRDEFEKITYAYNILRNEKTRNEYNMMNGLNKTKFHKILENIFNTKLDINILKDIGITITNKDFEYIENYNFVDIINLITKNIITKKESDNNICSDSDIDVWTSSYAEYYNINNIPIIYQKYNNNNIILNLNITLDNLINNSLRKIKINRNINNEIVSNTFKFLLNHPIIIYKEGGDICNNIYNNNYGHLIINLHLPKNYYWDNSYIYYDYKINLYEYFYGINNKINVFNKEIEIINFIPYRDGYIYNTNIKLEYYECVIKFNLIYIYNDNNKNILQNNFTK